MICEAMQQELVGFHFGVATDATRLEVEAHLQSCRNCLASYLALKHDLESGEAEPRPSPAARARLRTAVVAALNPEVPAWRWWERPLAFSFASVTVLLALLTMHLVATAPGDPPHGLPEVVSPTTEPR